MFEPFFETYRKASESWLHMQQELFRSTVQQWMSASPTAAGAATDWSRNVQKRFLDFAVEILNRQRESLEATYKSVIQILEQSSRVAEAKSPEEYRRGMEELWRRWFESVKTQSESQFRDVQNWAGKSLEIVQGAAQA